MSFHAQALLTRDSFLIDRIAACAATFGEIDARTWAANQMWPLSASPGWAERYDAAIERDEAVDSASWTGRAGADPEVITDEMIRDRVAAILAPDQLAPSPAAEESIAEVAPDLEQLQPEID